MGGAILYRCRRKGEACKMDNLMEDQISVLPDELVCTILSLLTMKEAARTSVLSRRWENLWKYFTGSLDFDGSKTMDRMAENMKTMPLATERNKYINWVNQVLNMHQGQDIDEFRVCFDLDKNSANIIDGWINFAMEKRVRRLELDLLESFNAFRVGRSYTFPLISLPVVRFSLLTALCLKKVDMTDDVFAHLLSNCPLIEELSLVDSRSLINVKIAGPLKLKCLELALCRSLKNIEISAINLVSFKYFGPRIYIPFFDIPLLSELSIGGFDCAHVVCTPPLSGVFYQLETLVLHLDFTLDEMSCFSRTCPEFRHLKNLELEVTADADQSVLCLNYLIDASPCLYKLVFKFWYGGCLSLYPREPEAEEFAGWRRGKPREEGRNRGLECLKVLEIAGWVGNTSDTELAVNLLENAVSLDKIIIDPGYPSCNFMRSFEAKHLSAKWNDLAGARERAKQLESKLHPGTELVIL